MVWQCLNIFKKPNNNNIQKDSDPQFDSQISPKRCEMLHGFVVRQVWTGFISNHLVWVWVSLSFSYQGGREGGREEKGVRNKIHSLTPRSPDSC